MSHSLQHIDTAAPKHLDKDACKAKTLKMIEQIGECQRIMYAQGKYSILLILQGLDASGKDGVVKHICSGLNPLGVDAKGRKAPTDEELSHDFLWRIHQHTPATGQMMIFNRSHYEDVLVPVVEGRIDNSDAKVRYSHINHFEKLLEGSHTRIIKCYLHISRDEQLARLQERMTNPEKYRKHNSGDRASRAKWDDYMDAYHKVFEYCKDPERHIIPADDNRYKVYLIAKILLKEFKKMDLEFPGLDEIMAEG